MLYERKQNQQVLSVIPISSILGKLPLIPVGDTGTIPFSMRDKLSMGLVMVQTNVALNGTKGELAVIFCF